MKLLLLIGLILTALQPGAQATDRLTSLDSVRLSGPSIQLEWLFNMGLVTGINSSGQLRHFAIVFNTLIGPHLRRAGPVPYISLTSKPVILLTLHDLDQKQVLHREILADSLDPSTFGVKAEAHSTFLTRENSTAGMISQFQATTDAFEFSAHVISTKPQALFGDQGWADNGSLGKALYLSRTGRALIPDSRSWVNLPGESIQLIEGQFWEDHQLVNPLHLNLMNLKWNWFALHFADHSEAMIYQIQNKKTGELYSTFAQRVRPDGSIEPLQGARIIEGAPVLSRGFKVPTEWKIHVPGKAWLHLKHIIPAPWYDVTLGVAQDSALEGACTVQGNTIWGDVTLAWGEHTNSDFFTTLSDDPLK